MKRDDKFEDAPKGKLTIIDDFLPPPSQLVRKEDTVKITLDYDLYQAEQEDLKKLKKVQEVISQVRSGS